MSNRVKSTHLWDRMDPARAPLPTHLWGIRSIRLIPAKLPIGGENILELEPNERAKLGLFLAFQYPQQRSPVSAWRTSLRMAVSAVRSKDSNGSETTELIPMREFRRELRAKMKQLGVDESFARRYLNDGFSGGEKKRAEVLQLAMLEPKIAILDETDSGLDIDAVRIVGESVISIDWPKPRCADYYPLPTPAQLHPAAVHTHSAGRKGGRIRRVGTR